MIKVAFQISVEKMNSSINELELINSTFGKKKSLDHFSHQHQNKIHVD